QGFGSTEPTEHDVVLSRSQKPISRKDEERERSDQGDGPQPGFVVHGVLLSSPPFQHPAAGISSPQEVLLRSRPGGLAPTRRGGPVVRGGVGVWGSAPAPPPARGGRSSSGRPGGGRSGRCGLLIGGSRRHWPPPW